METVASLMAGGLELELSQAAGEPLRLAWTGRSHQLDPAPVLGSYLQAVLHRARVLAAPVELHFERLEFFNPPTVTAVIEFLREARAQGTAVTVVYDGAQRWQAVSFEALRGFARGDGLLEFRPSAGGAPAR